MSEKKIEKKSRRLCTTYDEAVKSLKEYGYSDLTTNGGPDWNEKVRSSLETKLGAKVILLGETPFDSYSFVNHGTFRYTVEIKTNLEGKALLSETMD